MSKKQIKISNVKVLSDVEAIFMNSGIISKVVRAEVELETMRKMYDECTYPSPDTDAAQSMIQDRMVNTFKLVDELYEAITEEKAYKCSLEEPEPEPEPESKPEKKDETELPKPPKEINCAI